MLRKFYERRRACHGAKQLMVLVLYLSVTSGLEIMLPKWKETFLNKAPAAKLKTAVPILRKREPQTKEPPALECRDLHLMEGLVAQRRVNFTFLLLLCL